MEASKYTLEQAAVNTLRVISCEAISKAQSGHSGIALSAAPLLYAIYKNMNYDRRNGSWFNRDRFVMSAGHGSAILYTTLKCFGFEDIDLKTFRQFGSSLTGHPELNEKIGVDCSTGPLGQGIGMAVGMAIAEKKLAATYNKQDYDLINHYTYCLCGDGCLMEGVSYEAVALAGHLGLNKLILVYDCNRVTLDGGLENASSEDVKKRFQASGWRVLEVADGNDELAIGTAIKRAKNSKDMPTIVICYTEIGHGAKNAGSNKAHGQVLSAEDLAQLRADMELVSTPFKMDADVATHFEKIVKTKNKWGRWRGLFRKYGMDYPLLHSQLSEFIDKPHNHYKCSAPGKQMSGRDAGSAMLNQIAAQSPRLFGGGADVVTTTKAFVHTSDGGIEYFTFDNPLGSNIAYGIREFAMGAVSNGLALHGFTPYCSTFLAFSDYAKPAIRLSALMNLPVTYVFTHDGIGNAPDGSTHQCSEHIAALRVIPNLHVYRPCDDFEVAAVYEYVFEKQSPAAIVLSRGDLVSPAINPQHNIQAPRATILSSGSEVAICTRAQKILGAIGIFVNVISVPCLESFNISAHPELNPKTPVVAVEMGSSMPWYAFMGRHNLRGAVVGFNTFGATGANDLLAANLGFTPEHIADVVQEILK